MPKLSAVSQAHLKKWPRTVNSNLSKHSPIIVKDILVLPWYTALCMYSLQSQNVYISFQHLWNKHLYFNLSLFIKNVLCRDTSVSVHTVLTTLGVRRGNKPNLQCKCVGSVWNYRLKRFQQEIYLSSPDCLSLQIKDILGYIKYPILLTG